MIQTENVLFQEVAIREMVDAGLPISAIRPSTDKETRFAPVHLRYSLGRVWHAEGLDPQFLSEILGFPQSKNDDQVDALVFEASYDVRYAIDRVFRQIAPFYD